MTSKITTLKNFLKTYIVYPITKTKAVYDDDGNRLDNTLAQMDADFDEFRYFPTCKPDSNGIIFAIGNYQTTSQRQSHPCYTRSAITGPNVNAAAMDVRFWVRMSAGSTNNSLNAAVCVDLRGYSKVSFTCLCPIATANSNMAISIKKNCGVGSALYLDDAVNTYMCPVSSTATVHTITLNIPEEDKKNLLIGISGSSNQYDNNAREFAVWDCVAYK